MDVLRVADAALDQSQVAEADGLDVVDGRPVKLHQFQQREDALVDVEQGHVAAEAAGQRRGGDLQLAVGFGRPIGLNARFRRISLRRNFASARFHFIFSTCWLTGSSSYLRWPMGMAKPTRFRRITPTGQIPAARSAAAKSVS